MNQEDLFGAVPEPPPKPEEPRKPIIVRQHTRVPRGLAERKPVTMLAPVAPDDRAIRLVAFYADQFPSDFLEYFHGNQHVYRAFKAEALRVVRKGFQHYSARTIIEVLRHNSALNEAGGAWKLNNDRTPFLARLFALDMPEHRDLFEFRRARAAERA